MVGSFQEALGWVPGGGALGAALVAAATFSSRASTLREYGGAVTLTLLAILCGGWEAHRRRQRISFEMAGSRVIVRRRGAVVERLHAGDVAPAQLVISRFSVIVGLCLVGCICALCLSGAILHGDAVSSVLGWSGATVGTLLPASSMAWTRNTCVECEIPMDGSTLSLLIRRGDLARLHA
jgi:hypothetical protein